MTETTETAAPAALTLEEILADLNGFGVEEMELPLRMTSNGRTVEVYFSNIAVSQEHQAHMATEEFKSYTWVQQIKVDTLLIPGEWVDHTTC